MNSGLCRVTDAFVAVAAADLVDALEAADEQPLQVELGRDAHEELHIERVVVRDERLGRGAADERVHRRRLDLEKAALVEEAAQLPHDDGSRARNTSSTSGFATKST